MSRTDVHHVSETRPPSLVFQLLGAAQSVTPRLTEALAKPGLSVCSNGGITLLVPAGWRTEIDFRNHDGMLPHCAEIIAHQSQLRTQLVARAIPRAFMVRLNVFFFKQKTAYEITR